MSEIERNIPNLINQYLDTGEFFWNEDEKVEFRQLYYKLFCEKFGESRLCWRNAIIKAHKELNKTI